MKKDVNPKLEADVLHVGLLYALSNLSGSELHDALEILSAYRAGFFGEAKELGDKFCRPEFGASRSYFTKKQFVALLSKVPFRGSDHERKDKALRDFLHAERKCRMVNRKLRWYNEHRNRIPDILRVALSRAREEIRKILGPLDERALGRVIKGARPGSGVAIGTWNKYRVSVPFKLGATSLCHTTGAKPYLPLLVEGSPVWCRLYVDIDWPSLTFHVPYVVSESNRITFVPKDARTLRTIAIEPALNMHLQLGVHSYIAKRLERCGNNITDQTRNQDLARIGSLLGFGDSVATIDLSQASDSVSYELVRWLLPSDWFTLLDDLRCKTGTVDGKELVFEKFSSMGNGYTFALETLIFLAMCRACNSLTGGNVASCYGDDIIISDNTAGLLLEVLKWTGFSVNVQKTFLAGPFRESCGADWHNGNRVTPQYIRKPELRCTDVYSLLNRLDPVFRIHEIRTYLLGCIRETSSVLYGLENEDTSSCLFAPFDFVKGGGFLKWRNDFQTWSFDTIHFEPESPKTLSEWAYAASLLGGRGSQYSLRGRGKFRLKRSILGGKPPEIPRYGGVASNPV